VREQWIGEGLKKNQWILGLAVLAALAGFGYWGRNRIHFNFRVFAAQLALADWRKIALALVIIYSGYLIRSMRWALLLRHIKKVGPFSLLGTQVIGFTGVALLGRIADPVRPYLVAKKTGLPLSHQVAVYIIERLMDMGAMALIFCSVILLAPTGALPHPEVIKKVAYGGLTTTLLGALFLLAVRVAGSMVATYSERIFGVVSKKLGLAVGQKIRTFHAGLDTMRSFSDFAAVGGLSLLMWGLIVLAYFEIMRAFVASPQLAYLTLPKCMLVMAWGMLASAFQLPVVGWFTQIGFVAAALTGFFGVAAEPATACAATLLLVSFLGIVPVGLLWAQFEHVSLRKVAAESEQAEEELEDHSRASNK
jgi:uncharacterized protein (TIRG00374 family)